MKRTYQILLTSLLLQFFLILQPPLFNRLFMGKPFGIIDRHSFTLTLLSFSLSSLLLPARFLKLGRTFALRFLSKSLFPLQLRLLFRLFFLLPLFASHRSLRGLRPS